VKVKTRSILTFFLIFFFISAACEKRKAGWSGTIELEYGVKLVKNPKEPVYGEILFDLEEDLSIGNEDDENYIFYLKDYYRAKNVALDPTFRTLRRMFLLIFFSSNPFIINDLSHDVFSPRKSFLSQKIHFL